MLFPGKLSYILQGLREKALNISSKCKCSGKAPTWAWQGSSALKGEVPPKGLTDENPSRGLAELQKGKC